MRKPVDKMTITALIDEYVDTKPRFELVRDELKKRLEQSGNIGKDNAAKSLEHSAYLTPIAAGTTLDSKAVKEKYPDVYAECSKPTAATMRMNVK